MTAFLENLIESSQRFHAEYDEQLSNHLPMALIALEKLGANEQRLEQFYQFYSKRLNLAGAAEAEITDLNWQSHLGKHTRYQDYRDYFTKKIHEMGMEKAAREYLPSLVHGLAGGAFHPLIRVAYSVEAGSKLELASGLASFAIAYLPLGDLCDVANSFDSPVAVLEAIHVDANFRSFTVQGPNIFTRMSLVSQQSEFKPYLDALETNEKTLREMAKVALQLYCSTKDNFTALHVVTSCHALRVLRGYLSDLDRTLRLFWQAVCAAYITIEVPKLAPQKNEAQLPSWAEIKSAACESDNDHVIKLVYTCFEEFSEFGDPLYQWVAAKKSGMLPESI